MEGTVAQRIQRMKGVWSCHNVKTLETATTLAGTVWEQGELSFTVSDAVLFIYSVRTHLNNCYINLANKY